MNEQIKQIAQRLVGLRDALDVSPDEMARVCNLTSEEYLRLESGTVDISVSVLHQIAQAYHIELTTLMFGDEPKMNAFFVTRKGKGTAVERVKAYKYQSLGAGFAHRLVDPFIVTVHPKPAEEELIPNSHPGQEFNLVLSGCLLLKIGDNEVTLNEGDSIYFNAQLPHAMKALNGAIVQFLAIIM